MESVCFTREPFAVTSPFPSDPDRRTRIMLFAMNLRLQPGENGSLVTADAEDAAHRAYDLKVEYVGPVPHQEWLSTVVLRLNDNLGDVGDVLVRVSYNGVRSNRVRIAIGHSGGGPPDDQGATPTPVKPYSLGGQVRDEQNQGVDGIQVTLADRTDGTTKTLTTMGGGKFSFTDVAPGHNFTITPSNTAIFNFNAQTIEMLMSDSLLDFKGVRRLYSISGKLIGALSGGTAGVTVNLSGSRVASTTSDSNGNYQFAGVPAAGDYTITVLSTPYYNFTAQSRTSLSTNQIANFEGILRNYSISGKLIGALSGGTAGATVNLSGSKVARTTSDSNGNYQFAGVPAAGDYTITVLSTPYYNFTAQSLTSLSSNQIANFEGILRNYSINGKLIGAVSGGTAGTTVNLSGSRVASTTSDSNGNYQFAGVPAAGDYTITVLSTPYYNFTAQSLTNLSSNQIANFEGILRYYTVSGWAQLVHDPAPFLEIPISGSQATSVTTDAGGRYSIDLPAGGNYTLTPSVRHYYFDPPTWVITDLTSDKPGRYFFGRRRLLKISGKLVNQEGNGLAGLTVNLTGAEQRTTVTGESGNYQFPSLLAGYNYTVTPPSTASYTFTTQNISELSNDQPLDFVGLRRLLLQGRVKDQNGNGIIGVSVALAGNESDSVLTGADGSYSFRATATGNYTVTPSISQGWYTFEPANRQFSNLAGPQITDFISTLAPVPDPSFVLEFDGQPKTVDYGNFWQEGVDLGHFFWEFWAMPGPNAGATYLLSDGYGGAHALLFGVGSFNTSEPNRYELLGNIFDGEKFDNYFGSDVGPAIGEWGHFAVGWDGQNIYTYFNGVPVGKTPFAGPRRTPGPGGGGGRLLIGGSDHSNFEGRIAQVRGYEYRNPREEAPGSVEASFAPQAVFGNDGNLISWYFRTTPRLVADLSRGHDGVAHPGWLRGTTTGIINYCETCPSPKFVIDPSAPNFATGTPPQPVFVQTPPAMPGGAMIFDSFSRANSTLVFGSNGGLGSTEGGSGGAKVWQHNGNPGLPQPFGILNGRAVLLGNDTSVAWIVTGPLSGSLDVRIDRRPGRWGSGKNTGLSFRVIDAQNFFFAYTAEVGGAPGSQILKVGYYSNGQRVNLATGAAMPSTWLTLRTVTSANGDLLVFADHTLVYSTNSSLMATATGAGLYNNSAGLGLVNRWDNFKVFNVP